LQSWHSGIAPALGQQMPRFHKEHVSLAVRIIGVARPRGHFGRPFGQTTEPALVVPVRIVQHDQQWWSPAVGCGRSWLQEL